MTQCNQYAKRLDTAFKTPARNTWRHGTSSRAAQKANYRRPGVESGNLPGRERPKTAAGKGGSCWRPNTPSRQQRAACGRSLTGRKRAIRRDLESEVRASSTVDPDAIDANALELLKSGILTADDVFSLVSKYDEQPYHVAAYQQDRKGACRR